MPRPNIDKMLTERHKTEIIHDFLEFVREKGIQLSKDDPDNPRHPILYGTEGPRVDALLYEFIGVDPVELENEKQAILDTLDA